jgi:hypothetical protein
MEFVLLFIAVAAVVGLAVYLGRRVRSASTLAGTTSDRRAVGGRRGSLPSPEPRPAEKPKLKPSKLVLVLWKGPQHRPPLWPLQWPRRKRREPHPPGWRERELELRKLDVRIAKDLFLYEDVIWSEVFGDQPTGIPKTKYDTMPHHLAQKEREEIPRYSYYESAFLKVTERMKGIHIYELYIEVLKECAPGEGAAFEHRCHAALKAKERYNRKSGS